MPMTARPPLSRSRLIDRAAAIPTGYSETGAQQRLGHPEVVDRAMAGARSIATGWLGNTFFACHDCTFYTRPVFYTVES